MSSANANIFLEFFSRYASTSQTYRIKLFTILCFKNPSQEGSLSLGFTLLVWGVIPLGDQELIESWESHELAESGAMKIDLYVGN